jgi:5-formyltetrahydrofolate cyclo-ligase
MTGARIGYGKGYYDRLLAELNAPTAGLCFEHQLVGHIPCESHDRRVHMIITEKRIIYCDGYQKD